MSKNIECLFIAETSAAKTELFENFWRKIILGQAGVKTCCSLLSIFILGPTWPLAINGYCVRRPGFLRKRDRIILRPAVMDDSHS